MPAQDIYGALTQRPMSVDDYNNALAQQQATKLDLAKNALSLKSLQQGMDEKQRALQEQDQIRTALTGLGANATDEQRISALKGTGLLSAYTQADSLEQAGLKRKQMQSEADYKSAQTKELSQKTDQEKVKLALQGLSAANDPMSAARVAISAGLVPQEQAQQYLQSIPRDPQGFAQWKQQQMMQGVELAKQFDIQNAQSRDAESARHNKTTEGISAGNLAVSRQRLAFDQNQPKGVVHDSDAGTVLIDPRTGAAMPVTMGGAPLGKPLKDIPQTVNTAIIGNNKSIAAIDRALTLLNGKNVGDPAKGGMTGDAEATGLKGYLPNGVLNRLDPQGVETRAEISDIGSLKIHDRSGAAVTISESPRLLPFIPLATDDSATVKKKLGRLKLELANEGQALADTYSKEQGYKPSPVARPQAQTKTVVRTGTHNGKKVVQYSDGTVDYAD